MTLSAQDYRDLILVEVGDDGTVAPYIDTLWEKQEAAEGNGSYFHYLVVKADAIRMLMGAVWADVSTRMPSRAEFLLREKFANLKALLESVMLEISGGAGSAYSALIYVEADLQVGEMEATAPIMGIEGFPDPNDTLYLGDPTRMQETGRTFT